VPLLRVWKWPSQGSATASSGTFTVKGGGADVWGTADAFRYAYTTLSGDGAIVARVASVQNVASWTKVGVMLRQSVDPGSAHGFMLVSAAKGYAFQRRPATGGLSEHTPAAVFGTAPQWVKLERAGQLVTASISPDGSSWTVVGTATINFSGPILAGLAVSSHDATRLAQGTFDNVTVSP